MTEHWTRRNLLILSALAASGCGRSYGTRSSAAPQGPVSGPVLPPSSPIAPLPEPEPVPDIPAPLKGNYVVVPRSAWTRQAVRSNVEPMNGVTRLTVHHTGEHGNWSDLPDIEVVRRIESYHRSPKPNGKNWCAIGYHYLVGRDGRIYEGRPCQFQGAHTLTANEHNVGISVIGDFMHRLPNSAQLAALSKFLDDQSGKYHVAKNRIYGHRDLHSSLCPGNELYAWLQRSYKA